MMRLIRACAAAAGLAYVAVSPAAAIPASPTMGAYIKHADLQTVHYRRYYHCHWRHGYRRCHGFARYYDGYGYGYGYGPGIHLHFGHGHGHGFHGHGFHGGHGGFHGGHGGHHGH